MRIGDDITIENGNAIVVDMLYEGAFLVVQLENGEYQAIQYDNSDEYYLLHDAVPNYLSIEAARYSIELYVVDNM